MTLDKLIKSSLDDWAHDIPVPADLSSQVLMARRHRPSLRGPSTVAAVALVVAAIAVPFALTNGSTRTSGVQVARAGGTAAPSGVGPTVWPSPNANGQPLPFYPTIHPPTEVRAPQPPSTPWTPLPLTHAHSGNTTISAHPEEAPPQHLIAADDLALSAYGFASHLGPTTTRWTWYLYNPTTDTYARTAWSILDVSPGLGLAAVLAGPSTSNRIGIVDMATGSVIRWITTSKPVGTVEFSPDGTKLVATTFVGNPDNYQSGTVTGFIIINLRNGYQTVVSSVVGFEFNTYTGVKWTANGAYLYAANGDGSETWFYTPDGHSVPAPPHAALLTYDDGYGANVSPNGKLAQTNDAPGTNGSPLTSVANFDTGKIVNTQPVEELDGWANNDALIGWGCAAGCSNEFHSRMVLVSLDGKSVVPLTGFAGGKSDKSSKQWWSLLTRR